MKKEYTIELPEIAKIRSDKLVIMKYSQGDEVAHDHRFFELVYITGGNAVHVLDDRSSRLMTGDFLFVDYGSLHSYSQSHDFTLINCLFLPEIVDDTLKDCHSFDAMMRECLMRYYRLYFGQSMANRIFHDDGGKVLSLLQGLLQEYEERKAGYEEIFRCHMKEILILTMRSIVHEDRKHQESTLIREAITYLDGHYAEKAVLGSFCQQYHYSLQYISRRFRQETGMTAREYLQKIRIEKSCELLAGSSMHIEEIAQSVGYSDTGFYQELFRRMLKMSPGEYRRSTL